MTRMPAITAVILAGGRGRRMGGRDKGLIELNGKPLIQHVIAAISPQVGPLVISANRNLQQYADLGYPVICDSLDGFQGPLAGILATMRSIGTPDMVTVPCDGPALPHDLVARLAAGRKAAGADIAVAHDGQRLHPVYALISRRVEHDLASFLESGGRKMHLWLQLHQVAAVDFSDTPEAFANINTPQDHARLQPKERACPESGG